MNPAMICCSTLSKAGDLSGRVLPRDLYLWVIDSRGGRLGPQKSVWVWWPLSLALLSWSSRLLLRKGLKSWKNIVGSKWSQNSAKCVDVLPPPPKKLESSVTSSINPDSHLGQIYSGSLGLTSPLQKWQKNRCAATAAPAPAPAAEASAIFLSRRRRPRGQPARRSPGRCLPATRDASASAAAASSAQLAAPESARVTWARPAHKASARTATPRPASRHQRATGRRVRPALPSRRLL